MGMEMPLTTPIIKKKAPSAAANLDEWSKKDSLSGISKKDIPPMTNKQEVNALVNKENCLGMGTKWFSVG
jgi:hypothetical protein